MSTKIYNGFRFTTTDMRKIHKYIMEFRRELVPLIAQKYYQYIAFRAAYMYDRLMMRMPSGLANDDGYPNLKNGVMFAAMNEHDMRRRKVEKTGLRDPIIDVEVSMAIIPIPMKTLGIIYVEHNDFRDLWMSKPFVKEYGYWNNTDQPENLNNRQWDRRRKDWDNALKEFDAIPSMNGFSIDCNEKFIRFPNVADILPLMPPFIERAMRVAKAKMLDDRIKRKRIKLDNLSKWNDERRALKKYLKTEAGKKAFNNRVEKVKKKIPRKFSKKALLREFLEDA